MSRVDPRVAPLAVSPAPIASLAASTKVPAVVWATAWVSFLTDMSTELVYSLFPVFYTLTLHLSVVWQGVIEGVAETIASLTKLFSGHWSDRTGGRKWWMVAGYGLSGISKPLLPWAGGAGGAWGVLVARGADRLGKGIRGTPRDAIVSREVRADQRGKAFGIQRAMDHAGAMLGSLIAFVLLITGVIHVDHLNSLFWWTLLPSGLAVMIIVVFVREHAGKAIETPQAKTPLSLGRAWHEQLPAMKRYLLVLAVFSLGNSTDALLLLRSRDQIKAGGVSEQTAAALIVLLWAWLHLIKSASSTKGGQLSDRVGRRALLNSGWVVYALVYVGFALWNSPVAPWILFGVYGLYYGLVEGPERALVADLCPDHNRRGSAFGLFNFVVGIMALPASALCGGLWYYVNPATAFLTGGALALLAATMLPWALRK